MLRGLRTKKNNKVASEITLVGDKEIQFLSSVSLPNLRQALGENFLDSDSGYEDYTSDSDDGSENILDRSRGQDASDMSDEDFPVRRRKRFAGKKTVEGESGRKREKTSSKDVQRLKGSRKDCKMDVQPWCEEKSRTDKSFSLFPLQKKIVTKFPTAESGKKRFAEISQRMFSEIMSAFRGWSFITCEGGPAILRKLRRFSN